MNYLSLLILLYLAISCKNEANDNRSIAKSFKIVVIDTVESFSSSRECFGKSSFTLPYSQRIDPKKVVYQMANCKLLGADKFLCGKKSLRYISFPKFENVTVILVPMDCGDFSYRYYLVTLFDKQIVSDYYVEGEWYEPGDEGYKELTYSPISNHV